MIWPRWFKNEGVPSMLAEETNFGVVPILFTAKARLRDRPNKSYSELGIGVNITDFEVSGTVGNVHSYTRAPYRLHAGVGVNYKTTDTIFRGAAGRYVWAKPSLGEQDIRLDGYAVTGTPGFRF